MCDYCAKKLDGDHLNTCICIPSYPREHRKKVMHDGVERPTDVCEDYEPRKDIR